MALVALEFVLELAVLLVALLVALLAALLPALCPPVAVLPLGEKQAAEGSMGARRPSFLSIRRPRVCSSLGGISPSTPSKSPTNTRSIVASTAGRSQPKTSVER